MIIPELTSQTLTFPHPSQALQSPNGLLAVGGDLSPQRLLEAYRIGVFPWFSNNEPVMWWSPNPRAVITPTSLHISKSMKKWQRNMPYHFSWNKAFQQVIKACAAPRAKSPGTWILPEMQNAYSRLHSLQIAHSIEVWHNNTLVGGLYGICLGPFFFGESMFSTQINASKAALIELVTTLKQHGLQLLDCQIMNPHLRSLGAQAVHRVDFLQHLNSYMSDPISSNSPEAELSNLELVRNSVLNIYLRNK